MAVPNDAESVMKKKSVETGVKERLRTSGDGKLGEFQSRIVRDI